MLVVMVSVQRLFTPLRPTMQTLSQTLFLTCLLWLQTLFLLHVLVLVVSPLRTTSSVLRSLRPISNAHEGVERTYAMPGWP